MKDTQAVLQAVLNEVHAHISMMADVENRVNSIVAVTGMPQAEVYHAVYVLSRAWGGDNIIELLDWIYKKVAGGETIQELLGE